MEPQLDYGNWIRKKNLLILGLCTLGSGVLILLPFGSLYRVIVTILFILILVSFLFPLYAYGMFSQKGGKFQEKIFTLIIELLGPDVNGRIIDIGSGNGVLAVKLALLHSKAEVVGIDFWGEDWEYSKAACEKNARAAGVENRVHFQKGDAAALESADAAFDGAISNLTFHEVQSVVNKRAVLREALRVVKPGGSFAFVDYFFDPKYYGKAPDFENYLRDLQLNQCELKPLKQVMHVPLLLRHPRILGKVGTIYGKV